MPRKAKTKKPATGLEGPAPITGSLDEVIERAGLKTADKIPRQLEPAEPELLPLPRAEQEPEHRELITSPERDPVRHQTPTEAQNGKPQNGEPGPHAAAVLARRPRMQPTPPGFFAVAGDERAGIRISKSSDHKSVAIQFSEDRLPIRAEKDILERVGQPEDGQNFTYRTQRRQWERPVPDGWTAGENTLDAVRVMQELAAARNEGRGR